MDCKDIRPLLSAYYDKELEPGEREVVSNHLQSCKRCSAEYSEIRRTWEALKTADDIQVPSGFRARVLARVNAFSLKRARVFYLKAAAVAAVFLVAIGLIFFFTTPAGNPVAKNIHPESIAAISHEDAQIIENLDLLENYELLNELDEVAELAALEEITDEELEGIE